VPAAGPSMKLASSITLIPPKVFSWLTGQLH
jgi:hypothetical protein